MSEISHHFEDKFTVLDSLTNPIVLIVVNPIYYQDATISLLKYLSARLNKGIYISLNKPHVTIKSVFEKAGVSPGKILLVDGVTRVKAEEGEEVIFLGGEFDLTNICLTAAKVMGRLNGSSFLVFDSLSTLLIYNDEKSVAKFAHILSEKLRMKGIYGIILSVESQGERDLISRLTPFCDTLLRLGEEVRESTSVVH